MSIHKLEAYQWAISKIIHIRPTKRQCTYIHPSLPTGDIKKHTFEPTERQCLYIHLCLSRGNIRIQFRPMIGQSYIHVKKPTKR